MYPFPTEVLSHTLQITPDNLFRIVTDFVKPYLWHAFQALGPHDCEIAFYEGPEWDAERQSIEVKATEVCYLPGSEVLTESREAWSFRQRLDGKTVWVDPTQREKRTSGDVVLATVKVNPLTGDTLQASIVVTPGTDGESFTVRLAGHIVKSVQGQEGYEEWVKWMEQQITRSANKMTGIWILPVSFDVLDAVVLQYLPGLAPGWANIRRRELTRGSVEYSLSQDELGNLGTVTLRKLNDEKTELNISGPSHTGGRAWTQQEKDALHAISDTTERRQMIVGVSKKIEAESEELNRRRREHHGEIVQLFFSLMKDDLVFTRKTHIADNPLTEAHDSPGQFPKKPETRRKWKQAWDIMQELQTQYRDEWNNGGIDDPTPRNEDYADALANRMNWRPTTRTISEIKRAAKGGLFEQIE